MIREFVAAVLLSFDVPVQLPICQPLDGVAPLNEMASPAMYWLAEQPLELVGLATGSEP
jgi:hypothetical protein